MTPETIVHLVPHTHWDREWYEPFQTFRLRLVDLVDQLLARMVADERLRFTLDGQAATVDDYLEVRPEAEPLIRQLIAEGRLAIGPWQILLDEFLVSGETIVRNLELGWARAESLGAAMRVGYLPDMFGHIAQMPQILRRAGIDRAVVWRGVPSVVDRNTFTWSAPDGSSVETEYLVGGYGNGAYLFDVPDRLAAKLLEYRGLNAAFYGDRSLLAMYGTDHAVPSPRLADIVETVNAAGGPIAVRIETLADYLERDDGGSAGTDGPSAAWTGELRSGARANMLMNVVSARVDLKAAAARAERLLERYAEPLTALHGDAWPARLLELAWRRLVDNSAHDSICGCSHDAVVAQVIGRYAEAEQIAAGVVKATIDRIGRSVPSGGWAVVNPSPVDREELVELDVAVPPTWTSVAIRCDDRIVPTQEIGRRDPAVGTFRLRGHEVPEFFRRRRHGRELFGRQINGATLDLDADPGRMVILVDDVPDPAELDMEELLGGLETAAAERADAVWELVVQATDRRRILARVTSPALGRAWIGEVDSATVTPEPVRHPVEVDAKRLANGLVEVMLAADGSFRLAGSGADLDGVGRLVDGGDAGDSYNYGPPAADRLVETPTSVEVRVVERGPLRGVLEIDRRYDWPTGLTPDASARSDAAAATDVTTRLELRADEPFVRVRIEYENGSRDHRLRWHIPLPGPVSRSSAEGQFAVVERGLELEGGHGEVPLPTFPAVAFVSVEGCSVLLDQVTEYEVVDGRELALTVLRSIGLISRNANPYREDPAGPEIPIPAAQLRGPRTFAFALYPHAGDWLAAATLDQAERYRYPFLTVRGSGRATVDAEEAASAAEPPTTAPPSAPPPASVRPGLRIEGDGVVLSALRRRAGWLELRVVNERPRPVTAIIHTAPGAAREADLLGRPGASLAGGADGLHLDLGPWEIRTVQLALNGEDGGTPG